MRTRLDKKTGKMILSLDVTEHRQINNLRTMTDSIARSVGPDSALGKSALDSSVALTALLGNIPAPAIKKPKVPVESELPAEA